MELGIHFLCLQHVIMGVTVTATTTSGQPLPEADLQRVLQAADAVLSLDADKARILEVVKQRMHQIAPNLSMAIGEEIAARLMGVAGGLMNLSKMPACNVQVLVLTFSCFGWVQPIQAGGRFYELGMTFQGMKIQAKAKISCSHRTGGRIAMKHHVDWALRCR